MKSFRMGFRSVRPISVFMPLLLFHGVLIVDAQEKPKWQAEWDRVVQAAKKEGQVNIYISGVYGAVLDAGVFQKRYPEIRVVSVRGRLDVTQRIIAERRAGKYLADVFNSGIPYPYPMLYEAKALDPLKPLLVLPEVVDESKWFEGRHRYADPEREYVFIFIGNASTGGAAYNTNSVNPKEFKSFWDFLNPKWKGKILARDIRVPGTGSSSMRFFYHHPELGPDFIRRLFGEMDITLSRDSRQQTDWLATGKFPICFFCSDIDQAMRQGLPVRSFGFMKEGGAVGSQSGALGFMNKAPHPNAAKAFINWFLSGEGQLTLQRALAKAGYGAPDSLRIDIPKDDVAPENRRVEGVRLFDTDRPAILDMEPIYKIVNEAETEGKGRTR